MSTSKGKITHTNGRKRSVKKLTAHDIAKSIKKGLAEVKLIQEGKLKPITIEELLRKL